MIPPHSPDDSVYESVARRFGVPVEVVRQLLTTPTHELARRDQYFPPSSTRNEAKGPTLDYEKFPLNTPKIGHPQHATGNTPEAYVDYLREFDPHSLTLAEDENGMTNAPSTQKYVEWLNAGHQPPPTNVFDTGGGRLQTSNRRRTLAARLAGKKITGWFGPMNAESGNPLKHGDVDRAAGEARWDQFAENSDTALHFDDDDDRDPPPRRSRGQDLPPRPSDAPPPEDVAEERAQNLWKLLVEGSLRGHKLRVGNTLRRGGQRGAAGQDAEFEFIEGQVPASASSGSGSGNGRGGRGGRRRGASFDPRRYNLKIVADAMRGAKARAIALDNLRFVSDETTGRLYLPWATAGGEVKSHNSIPRSERRYAKDALYETSGGNTGVRHYFPPGYGPLDDESAPASRQPKEPVSELRGERGVKRLQDWWSAGGGTPGVTARLRDFAEGVDAGQRFAEDAPMPIRQLFHDGRLYRQLPNQPLRQIDLQRSYPGSEAQNRADASKGPVTGFDRIPSFQQRLGAMEGVNPSLGSTGEWARKQLARLPRWNGGGLNPTPGVEHGDYFARNPDPQPQPQQHSFSILRPDETGAGRGLGGEFPRVVPRSGGGLMRERQRGQGGVDVQYDPNVRADQRETPHDERNNWSSRTMGPRTIKSPAAWLLAAERFDPSETENAPTRDQIQAALHKQFLKDRMIRSNFPLNEIAEIARSASAPMSPSMEGHTPVRGPNHPSHHRDILASAGIRRMGREWQRGPVKPPEPEGDPNEINVGQFSRPQHAFSIRSIPPQASAYLDRLRQWQTPGGDVEPPDMPERETIPLGEDLIGNRLIHPLAVRHGGLDFDPSEMSDRVPTDAEKRQIVGANVWDARMVRGMNRGLPMARTGGPLQDYELEREDGVRPGRGTAGAPYELERHQLRYPNYYSPLPQQRVNVPGSGGDIRTRLLEMELNDPSVPHGLLAQWRHWLNGSDDEKVMDEASNDAFRKIEGATKKMLNPQDAHQALQDSGGKHYGIANAIRRNIARHNFSRPTAAEAFSQPQVPQAGGPEAFSQPQVQQFDRENPAAAHPMIQQAIDRSLVRPRRGMPPPIGSPRSPFDMMPPAEHGGMPRLAIRSAPQPMEQHAFDPDSMLISGDVQLPRRYPSFQSRREPRFNPDDAHSDLIRSIMGGRLPRRRPQGNPNEPLVVRANDEWNSDPTTFARPKELGGGQRGWTSPKPPTPAMPAIQPSTYPTPPAQPTQPKPPSGPIRPSGRDNAVAPRESTPTLSDSQAGEIASRGSALPSQSANQRSGEQRLGRVPMNPMDDAELVRQSIMEDQIGYQPFDPNQHPAFRERRRINAMLVGTKDARQRQAPSESERAQRDRFGNVIGPRMIDTQQDYEPSNSRADSRDNTQNDYTPAGRLNAPESESQWRGRSGYTTRQRPNVEALDWIRNRATNNGISTGAAAQKTASAANRPSWLSGAAKGARIGGRGLMRGLGTMGLGLAGTLLGLGTQDLGTIGLGLGGLGMGAARTVGAPLGALAGGAIGASGHDPRNLRPMDYLRGLNTNAWNPSRPDWRSDNAEDLYQQLGQRDSDAQQTQQQQGPSAWERYVDRRRAGAGFSRNGGGRDFSRADDQSNPHSEPIIDWIQQLRGSGPARSAMSPQSSQSQQSRIPMQPQVQRMPPQTQRGRYDAEQAWPRVMPFSRGGQDFSILRPDETGAGRGIGSEYPAPINPSGLPSRQQLEALVLGDALGLGMAKIPIGGNAEALSRRIQKRGNLSPIPSPKWRWSSPDVLTGPTRIEPTRANISKWRSAASNTLLDNSMIRGRGATLRGLPDFQKQLGAMERVNPSRGYVGDEARHQLDRLNGAHGEYDHLNEMVDDDARMGDEVRRQMGLDVDAKPESRRGDYFSRAGSGGQSFATPTSRGISGLTPSTSPWKPGQYAPDSYGHNLAQSVGLVPIVLPQPIGSAPVLPLNQNGGRLPASAVPRNMALMPTSSQGWRGGSGGFGGGQIGMSGRRFARGSQDFSILRQNETGAGRGLGGEYPRVGAPDQYGRRNVEHDPSIQPLHEGRTVPNQNRPDRDSDLDAFQAWVKRENSGDGERSWWPQDAKNDVALRIASRRPKTVRGALMGMELRQRSNSVDEPTLRESVARQANRGDMAVGSRRDYRDAREDIGSREHLQSVQNEILQSHDTMADYVRGNPEILDTAGRWLRADDPLNAAGIRRPGRGPGRGGGPRFSLSDQPQRQPQQSFAMSIGAGASMGGSGTMPLNHKTMPLRQMHRRDRDPRCRFARYYPDQNDEGC